MRTARRSISLQSLGVNVSENDKEEQVLWYVGMRKGCKDVKLRSAGSNCERGRLVRNCSNFLFSEGAFERERERMNEFATLFFYPSTVFGQGFALPF